MQRSARLAAVLTALVALGGCTGTGPAGSAPTSPESTLSATPAPAESANAAAPSPSTDPATATPEPPSAGPAVPVAMFASSVAGIDADLARRMETSWRPGCPVPLEDLRYVTVSHVDFAGAVQTGELVVHADVADEIVTVFADLFAARYPVRLMRLVDDYGGDDTRSMDADNTSAFNCRAITGGSAWSEHAYGRALDLNPVENPYVVGSHVAPRDGRAYVERPDLPGVIHDDDAVVRAFARAGWRWGGHWDRPVDYQHFSVTGR